MEKLADVRKRMQSVAGIGEVCRTLATVASAKLAQSHARARGARDFTKTLGRCSSGNRPRCRRRAPTSPRMSPLMVPKRDVRTITLVVVGADRGLCGGHNLALGRAARAFVLEQTAKGCDVSAPGQGQTCRDLPAAHHAGADPGCERVDARGRHRWRGRRVAGGGCRPVPGRSGR